MWPVFALSVLVAAVITEDPYGQEPWTTAFPGLFPHEKERLRRWARQMREDEALWRDLVLERGEGLSNEAFSSMLADWERWSSENPWKPIYFASGSNTPPEIIGFASIGQPLGVAAPKVTAASQEALERLAGTGVRVFVDSGAFSEVKFGPDGLRVVKPMSDQDWARVLDLYEELAEALGPQLHAVAPDRVGDQRVTLQRMLDHRDRIQGIAQLGARIIVPLQAGELDLARFEVAASEALGLPKGTYIPGIPSKKSATSTEDFVAWLSASKPDSVHLLGLGPRSSRAPELIEAARAANPLIRIYMDSVLVTAHVGRTGGPGGGPRLLTRTQDEIETEVFEAHVTTLGDTILGASGDPTAWMTRSIRKRLARELELDVEQTSSWRSDPTAFLQSVDDELFERAMPLVAKAAEQHFYARPTVQHRRQLAIMRAFGPMVEEP